MRAGNTTSMGGVFIEMAHLGEDIVSKKFPGMVKRCADCGFDLAGGRVEVVPTAHYMMGGIEFDETTSTVLPGLFVAGEDAGGVHGANRLGGNGVANSTVYGGIAGEQMAKYVKAQSSNEFVDPDHAALEAGIARAEQAFAGRDSGLADLRDKLGDVMWERLGILRTEEGMLQGMSELKTLKADLQAVGVDDGDRAFNLSWHEWLNMKSMLDISEVIGAASLARCDSRGAHFREDFPETGELEDTSFTRITASSDDASELPVEMVPVAFDIVRPGESLIDDEAGLPPAASGG